MGDDVAEVVHDEDDAATNAGFDEAMEDGVERDNGGEHAREIVLSVLEGDGDDEGGAVIGRESEGVAAEADDVELLGLHAGHESALKCFGDEWVLLGAEISLGGASALAGFADGGEIDEGFAVGVHEGFEKACDFRLGDRVFDVVDEAGEGKDLALAVELLALVSLEKLDFLGERAGEVGLLDALGVYELFLAEVENLAVIEADGKGANQEQRAEDEPEDAYATAAKALD
jgi:hypothetical protein